MQAITTLRTLTTILTAGTCILSAPHTALNRVPGRGLPISGVGLRRIQDWRVLIIKQLPQLTKQDMRALLSRPMVLERRITSCSPSEWCSTLSRPDGD